jgi:N4-gp56 family major capsid protein
MSYNPAGNGLSNLPQSTVKYYDKRFRENLKAQTPFVACAERLDLPMKSGNQYEMFMYVPLAANTNQTTEGNINTASLAVSVLTTTATIGEYADYANFSSLSLATAIDQTVENVAKEMSYRLGESLSALVRATADGANSIDSSVLTQLAATSTSSFTALSLSQIRNSVQSLAGRSVRPFDEASKAFVGVIHPFALGDVLADNSNDSPIDILKHTPVGAGSDGRTGQCGPDGSYRTAFNWGSLLPDEPCHENLELQGRDWVDRTPHLHFWSRRNFRH